MFCMKCGKKIDDDSTFCPYCGGKVGESITIANATPALAVRTKSRRNRKVIIGITGGLAAILAVVGVIKLLSGGIGDTVAERLFLMSWQEVLELNEKEFKSELRDEGITYEQEDSEYSSSLLTTSVSPFMDYDCIFGYTDLAYYELYGVSAFNFSTPMFIITFDTQDTYKDGKDDLLKYLNKNQSKLCDAVSIEQDDMDGYTYLLDVSTENLEMYVDCYEETAKKFFEDYDDNDDFMMGTEESLKNLENKMAEIRENLSDYKMYKFCGVAFCDLEYLSENAVTDLEKKISVNLDDYYDYGCVIVNQYLFMTDEEFHRYMAQFNYDAISKKDIDLDEVRKTIDVNLLDEKTQDSESDLRAIYFVENHGIDLKSGMDVSTDELKQIWYIKTFGWDNEAADFIDLSNYQDSTGIYCAVTFDYNIDDAIYFEGDLDKAVYLSERNYNSDTGESFTSEDEKRLYFWKNYYYDTVTRKSVDAEVVEALVAYADYSEEIFSEDGILGYNLIYIDDNDVPECLVWTGHGVDYGCRAFVLSYKNSNMESVTVEGMGGGFTSIEYIPKSGEFLLSSGDFHWDYTDKFILDDSFHKSISLYFNSLGADNQIYEVNGQSVSDESYVAESSNVTIDGGNLLSISTYSISGYDVSDIYESIFSAYTALRTTTYTAFAPEVLEFNLSDGILTVAIDDGSRYGWNHSSSNQEFSFSCPVSDNCIWEDRDVMMNQSDQGSTTSFEEMKRTIDDEQKGYEECIEEYGYVDISSPYEIHIEVMDDLIVRVYSLAH